MIHLNILLVGTVFLSTAFAWPTWQAGANNIRWAEYCDFSGHDLYSKPSTGAQCGDLCAADSNCNYFTWTGYNNGTCWLKQGYTLQTKPYNLSYSVCGYVQRNVWPNWNSGSNGIQWAENCDFDSHDLYSTLSNGQDCGGICANDGICTHFVWTNYNGGTCWMKHGTNLQPKQSVNGYSVCGYVLSRGSLLEIKQAIKGGTMPIRGTNLGGWLVAERWMTGGSPAWNSVPDNIANQGEYVTMKYLGHANGDAQFDSHRSTFITEQDFKDVAAAGLNTIRIPVGYWITGFDNSGGGDPDGWKVYAPGAINYLDKAIREWAPRNNLLVLISFHAAKGSQNGADHSAPETPGQAYWSSYPENAKNALDAVEWLARRYNNDISFLGIGLLNEPRWDVNETVLKQYYYDAYGRIRAIPSDCLLTTSPLLSEQDPRASGNWNSFMSPPGWQGIRHEWHRYQVWGFDSSGGWTAQKLIDYANNQLANDIKDWNGNWLFIGEWSIATAVDMSDDNTLRSYAQAQLGAFSKAKGGWTYWAWKFYNDDGSSRNQWSMKSMIKMGLLWML